MAISFNFNSNKSVTLEEFLFNVKNKIKNPFDEDALLSCGEDLYCLSNNETFLEEYINKELDQALDNYQIDNQYTSQSLMLFKNESFYIRVNWWPIIDESHKHFSGLQTNFSYNFVHDHNFPLLTVGYKGAYTTKIWEYDYNKVVGFIGEKVEMKFLEETELTKGKVMYFRPSKDIHKQIMPKDEFSISVNIILNRQPIENQYSFDEETGEINRLLFYKTKNYNKLSEFIESFNNQETITILESLTKSMNVNISNTATSTLNKIVK